MSVSQKKRKISDEEKQEVYQFMEQFQRAELAIRVCCYRAGFTRDFANKVCAQYKAPTKRQLFYE